MNRTWLFPYLTNQPVPIGSPKVREDHPYRKREGFHEFKDNLKNYKDYDLNWHHLTTGTIWNEVFPQFMKDFNIDYNWKDYVFISYIADGHDLSFHEYSKPMDIEVITDCHKYDKLRDINGTQLTAYHRLFVAPHQIATVVNKQPLTERIIRLNCDSMIIPLIPLIAPYFRKIYVYDYRDNFKFKETNDITDELTSYITFNVIRIFGK